MQGELRKEGGGLGDSGALGATASERLRFSKAEKALRFLFSLKLFKCAQMVNILVTLTNHCKTIN